MRQIIIDTETTGLDPQQGHRIIEIGCIELIDRQFTHNNFHCYLNPQRVVEAEALAVHGITNEFLQDKPIFSVILSDFLAFIKGAELIAHNAEFDIGFIDYEMRLLDSKAKPVTNYAAVFDTLALARKMFPGQRNSLDALCKRYKIDLSSRKLHGALLDARLLAEVYLAMTGGQLSLFTNNEFTPTENTTSYSHQTNKTRPPLPVIYANADEIVAHEKFLTILNNKCLWKTT